MLWKQNMFCQNTASFMDKSLYKLLDLLIKDEFKKEHNHKDHNVLSLYATCISASLYILHISEIYIYKLHITTHLKLGFGENCNKRVRV